MSELAGLEQIRYQLSKLELLTQYHQNVLINGNGKPGITTRMQQAEDRMDAKDKTELEKRNENWQVKFLLLSILLTQIVTYALNHK